MDLVRAILCWHLLGVRRGLLGALVLGLEEEGLSAAILKRLG